MKGKYGPMKGKYEPMKGKYEPNQKVKCHLLRANAFDFKVNGRKWKCVGHGFVE
jgi:hypothetical protein